MYEEGRFAVGLGRSFKTFPRRLQSIRWIAASGAKVGGSATSAGSGPVTVRSSDGQIVDIDLTWQYRIPFANVPTIYKEFGDKYGHFLNEIARSTLRDTAAHLSVDFIYKNRKEAEQQFFDALKAKYEERHVALVTFQMLKVILPAELDDQLERIVMYTLRTRETKEKLGPATERKETAKAVAELKAGLARDVATNETAIEHDRLVQTQREQRVLEDTKTAAEAFAANATAFVAQFEQATANQKALLARNITVTAQETALRVSRIEAAITERRAAHALNVAKIAADAAKTAAVKDGEARAYTTAAQAAARGDVYGDLADAAFGADDINALAWAEVVPEGEAVSMDLYNPGTSMD